MSELTLIEREAKQVRDFIAELKGLTPKFNAAKERAEEEMKLHLGKIDCERARLKELQDAAMVIVQKLGCDPVEIVEGIDRVRAAWVGQGPLATQIAPTRPDVYAEIEPVVAMADSSQDDATTEDVLAAILDAEVAASEEADTFESIGTIAAEITAAVADLAAEPPATPDATDAPEMTDEQVERKELDLAVAAPRSPKLFNAFAANPFAVS